MTFINEFWYNQSELGYLYLDTWEVLITFFKKKKAFLSKFIKKVGNVRGIIVK